LPADSFHLALALPEFPHEVLRVLDAFFMLDDDPAKTQLETASEAVYISFRRAFYLHHPTYHVAYEDFDMAEVSDQSVLTVRALLFSFFRVVSAVTRGERRQGGRQLTAGVAVAWLAPRWLSRRELTAQRGLMLHPYVATIQKSDALLEPTEEVSLSSWMWSAAH
jgi:hypothetical protein